MGFVKKCPEKLKKLQTGKMTKKGQKNETTKNLKCFQLKTNCLENTSM